MMKEAGNEMVAKVSRADDIDVAELDVFLAAYQDEPDGDLVNRVERDDLLTWGVLRRILAAEHTRLAAQRFVAAIHEKTPTGAWIAVQHHPNGDWSVAHHPLPWVPGDAAQGYKLPCDVHLPPATIVRAGCDLSTLKLAMEAEHRPRHFEGNPRAGTDQSDITPEIDAALRRALLASTTEVAILPATPSIESEIAVLEQGRVR